MNNLRWILSLALLLTASVCFSQNLKQGKITGNFTHSTFEHFAQHIEETTSYHFYYLQSDVDSFYITTLADNETLEKLLTTVFRGTDFQYYIDKENNVFITRGIELLSHNDNASTRSPGDTVLNLPNNTSKSRVVIDRPDTSDFNAAEIKLFEIGNKTNRMTSGRANIAGYVRSSATGEPVTGALVYTEHPHIQAVTDGYGYYSITLPKGYHDIFIKALGMNDTKRKTMLYANGRLNIDLNDRVIPLREVVIEAEKERNVKSTQTGMDRLNIAAIKQIPAVFGEVDLLRAVLALPGVQSVGEVGEGFNVRGGATDQNLILLNDNTIYNPSHFFGFFSAFDPDVVRSVELYKSAIPIKYGGRLSSVLNVVTKEGNQNKISGNAGIGVLTGKIHIEGPIVKDKTTFVVGVRSTYSDWLLKYLPKDYRKSKASFYDGTLHISHKINNKNSLYLTGYLSRDNFNLNSDTTYGYNNRNGNLKWKHIFNNQFYGVLTAGVDNYDYSLSSTKNAINAYNLSFGITQYNFKADFSYFLNSRHTFSFGLNNIYYKLDPGEISPAGNQSLFKPDRLQQEQALESALYFGDEYTISPKLTINYGLRFSWFGYLGPKKVYYYLKNEPKETTTVIDSVTYSTGQFIKTYLAPSIRFSARYLISANTSLKVSFDNELQYIHMLSNTTAISPTDIWKLSDPNIKPQKGYQVAAGIYKNFSSNTIETSVELYYKKIENYLDYKSGAVLLMNHHIETDVVSTHGDNYGAELMIKKTTGKLNGWMSYTYSRSLLQMDIQSGQTKINEGEYYPSNFDKPHSFNFIGNYKFSHRFSTSLNLVYSTGRPITLPIGIYRYGNSERVMYSDRNEYRIPDYFRMDASMNIEGNHKVHQKTHNSWTIGVYNLTGRKNAYSVYVTSENGQIHSYKLSIFGAPIPFVTYNIRF